MKAESRSSLVSVNDRAAGCGWLLGCIRSIAGPQAADGNDSRIFIEKDWAGTRPRCLCMSPARCS